MTGERYFVMVLVLLSSHIEQFSVLVCTFFDNIVQLLGHPKCDFNRIPIVQRNYRVLQHLVPLLILLDQLFFGTPCSLGSRIGVKLNLASMKLENFVRQNSVFISPDIWKTSKTFTNLFFLQV